MTNLEKWGGQQPAHTVSGRLEQAQKWLSHPERDDKGLGQRAIALIIAEGKKVNRMINRPINIVQLYEKKKILTRIFSF